MYSSSYSVARTSPISHFTIGAEILSLPVVEALGSQSISLHTHNTSDYSQHHQAQQDPGGAIAARYCDIVSSWLAPCSNLRDLTLSAPGSSTDAFSSLMQMCFGKLRKLEHLTCHCPAEQSFPQTRPYGGNGTFTTYTANTCSIMSNIWEKSLSSATQSHRAPRHLPASKDLGPRYHGF